MPFGCEDDLDVSKVVLAILLFASASPQLAFAPTKEPDVPVSRCFKEAFRVGTGIPVGSADDIAANRNLIYAVDIVVMGPGNPRKNTAAALGYVLHVADGALYFEPGTALTAAQAEKEVYALRSWGVRNATAVRGMGSNSFVRLAQPPLRPVNDVRIVRCTGLGASR